MGERKTATYKTINDAGGNRYKFFCDLTGALVCTTKKTYKADTPEQELLLGKWKARSISIRAINAVSGLLMRCSTLKWQNVSIVLPLRQKPSFARPAAQR